MIIVVSMSYISSLVSLLLLNGRKTDDHSCVNELYQQSGFSPSLDGGKIDDHSCVNELYQQSGFSSSLEWLKTRLS